MMHDAPVTSTMPLAVTRAKPGVTRKMTILEIADIAGNGVGGWIDHLAVARQLLQAGYGEKTTFAIQALLLANQQSDVKRRFEQLQRQQHEAADLLDPGDRRVDVQEFAGELLKNYHPHAHDDHHDALRSALRTLASRRPKSLLPWQRAKLEKTVATTPEMLMQQAQQDVLRDHDHALSGVRTLVNEDRKRAEWDVWYVEWRKRLPVIEADHEEELEYLDRDDPPPTACTGYDWSKPSPEEVREELRESKVGNAQWRIAVADMEGRKPAKDDLAIVRGADKGLEPETDTEANQRRRDKDQGKLWEEVWTHLGGRCASCARGDVPLVVHHVGGGDGRGERDRDGKGGIGVLRRIRRRIRNAETVTDFQLLCVGCHEKIHYGDKPRGAGRRLKARMPPV